MKKINFAIMGAGKIAHWMGRTLEGLDCVRPYAVGARELSRAQAFADTYGFAQAYGSYEALLADDQVDLVYIATPHGLHAEHMKQCIAAGKHILCEKAFCINAAEAREVLALAREKGVFVAEAIWPRFMPMAGTLADFAASGKIGPILGVTANLGYPVWAQERVHARSLGGGALLDVGIYNLTFASIVLGTAVRDIQVSAQMCPVEGTDRCESVLLTYENGATASLFSSIVGPTDRQAVIYGERGYAVVENVNQYAALRVYNADHALMEEVIAPPQNTGYEYEVMACAEAIQNGWLETPYATHEMSICMMELMDSIRAKMGLVYPND